MFLRRFYMFFKVCDRWYLRRPLSILHSLTLRFQVWSTLLAVNSCLLRLHLRFSTCLWGNLLISVRLVPVTNSLWHEPSPGYRICSFSQRLVVERGHSSQLFFD